MNFLYSLSGLAVGILVGMTGVGGGSLMTPLLVLAFGIHPATAVGTDLLYAAATKAVGTGVHGRAKSIDWRIVRRLAMGSVPAAIVTFLVMHQLDVQSTKGGLLVILLGVVLLLTSAVLLLRNQIVAAIGSRLEDTSDATIHSLTIATGAALGVLVMTTSVGAGAIGVTALLILYPRLATIRIVATDIAHAVPLTLVAGFGHFLLGDIDWVLLTTLLLGSVPGIIIGSLLAPRLPERLLRALLSVVLLAVSFKLMGAF